MPSLLLLFLAALSNETILGQTALSWHKTILGQSNAWLSFLVNTVQCTVQVSPEKLPTVRHILHRIQEGKPYHFKTVEEWAGVINWASIAYSALRPFGFHVYKWLAAAKRTKFTQPSHPLRILAAAMIMVLDNPPRPYPTLYRRANVWAASDIF